jgi:hypothetical protein
VREREPHHLELHQRLAEPEAREDRAPPPCTAQRMIAAWNGLRAGCTAPVRTGAP